MLRGRKSDVADDENEKCTDSFPPLANAAVPVTPWEYLNPTKSEKLPHSRRKAMLNFGGVPTCMTDFPFTNFSVTCPILAPGANRGVGWSLKGNGHVATSEGQKQG